MSSAQIHSVLIPSSEATRAPASLVASTVGAAGESPDPRNRAARLERMAVMVQGLVDAVSGSWRDALLAEVRGEKPDLPIDLASEFDFAIQALRDFKDVAMVNLPVESGGLGGRPSDAWGEDLAKLQIHVYESDLGTFGYTGCDADDYISRDSAVAAAVREHLVPVEREPIVPEQFRMPTSVPDGELQTIALRSAIERMCGQAQYNPYNPEKNTERYCAYISGWYRDVCTRDDYLGLQEKLEMLKGAHAQGFEMDWHPLVMATLDRIMDASPWTLHPDYGCVLADQVDELDKQAQAEAASSAAADRRG